MRNKNLICGVPFRDKVREEAVRCNIRSEDQRGGIAGAVEDGRIAADEGSGQSSTPTTHNQA